MLKGLLLSLLFSSASGLFTTPGIAARAPPNSTLPTGATSGCPATSGFYTDSSCTTPVTPPPYNLTSNPLELPEDQCVEVLTTGAGSECVSCSGGMATINQYMGGCDTDDVDTAYAYTNQCLSNGVYYELISCA